MIHQLNRYLCDPATGALLVGAQSGDAVDVDRAVYAAYDALPVWPSARLCCRV
jgi:acyl-CoA reductase-like NAD-dependent aldehyde dehydrogenase